MSIKFIISYICVLLGGGFVHYTCAQSAKIDSLLTLLQKNPQSDTTRVRILTRLCWEYRNSKPAEALKYGRMGVNLAQKLKFNRALPYLYTYMGAVYRNVGDYAKGLSFYLEAEKIALQNKDSERIGFALQGIAEFYQRENRTAEALAKLNDAIGFFEKIKHQEGLSYCYYSFGQIYDSQKDYPKALEYHLKAMNLRQNLPNRSALANTQMRVGSILQKQAKFSEALTYLSKAQNLFQTINDLRGESQVMLQIAKAQLEQQKATSAIQLAQKSLQIAQNKHFLEQMQDAYLVLAEAEAQQKNYANAYKLQQLHTLYRDSLLNQQNTNQMFFLQASFEDERKTEQIKVLEKDNQRKTLLTYSFIGGFLIVLALFFFLYRNNLQRIKANQQLAQANLAIAATNQQLQKNHQELSTRHEELQKSQEEILTQRNYIEEQNYRLNIANRKLQGNEEILRKAYRKLEDAHQDIAKKKQQLEESHRQITSSINSAKTIQEAVLPLPSELDNWLKEYFIINRPKDVVSGDFYWVDKVDNTLIVALADCTGHGVPGAFMTLIAGNLLTKIVKIGQITNPAQILQQLHQEVQSFLRQKQTGNNNGMDIALVALQTTDNQMISVQFAGAKRVMYYVLPNQAEIKALAGTRKSIGGEQNENIEFGIQSITLPAGSLVYLTTDGFEDQNDTRRKRFGEARLRTMLAQNSHLPLAEQKSTLEQALDRQMLDTTQRDDILVLGWRLGGKNIPNQL
ncbi:MAG: SpoIIE family protein phosphatase [Microscillaceae bacterium]|nr:SpoIIE family protein phosphatase [Microscillaceae bacterium]